MIAGVLGALCQLEVALQLVRENRSFRTVIGLVVLVLGGLIAAASLPDWHFEYLLQGEIIFKSVSPGVSSSGPTPWPIG